MKVRGSCEAFGFFISFARVGIIRSVETCSSKVPYEALST